MIDLLTKFANEGIDVCIDTYIHGMMKITLAHGNNHTYHLVGLEELMQSDTPDDDFTELLSHTYDRLKEFEDRLNDL